MTSAGKTEIVLCSAADIAPGSATKVEKAGLELAVFNVNGAFYVTDDHCTHGPGSLSEGFLDDEIIECNFHQGQFNVRTGEVVLPPCIEAVKTYPAFVRDGKVIIAI
jgi:nitrite reductase/ring-hydroxylating ferredoxin subunit